MELTGKIEKIGNVQDISASFKKRELVIRTEEQYPQPILIEFVQDKTNLLDGFNLGDRVTENINIIVRECTSPQVDVKYFVSLQGWRINADQPQQSQQPSSEPPSFDAPDAPAPDFSLDPQDDDLSF